MTLDRHACLAALLVALAAPSSSQIVSVRIEGVVDWFEGPVGSLPTLALGEALHLTADVAASFVQTGSLRSYPLVQSNVELSAPGQSWEEPVIGNDGLLRFEALAQGSVLTPSFTFGPSAAQAVHVAWPLSLPSLPLDLGQASGTYPASGTVVLSPDGATGILHLSVHAVVVGAPRGQSVGVGYCTTVPHSGGTTARLRAIGTGAAGGELVLLAEELNVGGIGFALVGSEPAFIANPGGSQGHLCLGGRLGRFVRPGELRSWTVPNVVSLQIDLGAMPGATGPVAVQAAETWYFQFWFRDANPTPTSNFTSALAVTFS